MTIIDHLSLGVAGVPTARVFYGRVLDIVGMALSEENRLAADGERS